jgi:glucan phosphoethanolaminetransferase (alkaline phosphatase superfamily)
MTDKTTRDSLATLRSLALLAVVFGAIGSIGLLRHAQKHPPPLLVAGFVVWVLAPFVILGTAILLSRRWPARIRATLCIVTLFVAAISLAIYLDDNIVHRAAKPAFVYVAVPPASVLAAGVALLIASLRGGKQNR